MSKSLKKLALTLACSAALGTLAPIAAPSFMGLAAPAHAGQLDEFRAVLARYGSFQAHARYGEVWIPAQSTVAPGWHPYPPCYWVHTKDLGWYFDDRTEWGRIVHHYGRWAHDAKLGWVWVAGEEFSPGWVVWRTSEQWVGWAPMPPEHDIKQISAEEFNSDKHWIFMDAKKFGSKCQDGASVAQPAQYPVLLEQTRLVTEIRFVRGIAVFVLPAPLLINIVDIDIGFFHPWSPCFFGAWFWNWNWLVNNIIIVINLPPPPGPGPVACNQAAPPKPQLTPIISNPPPGPGGQPPRNPGNPPRNTDQPPRNPDTPGRNAGLDPRGPQNPGLVDPRTPSIPPQVIFPNNPGRPSSVDPGRPPSTGNPDRGPRNPGFNPNGNTNNTPGTRPGGSSAGGSGATGKGNGPTSLGGLTRVPNRTFTTPTLSDRVVRGIKPSTVQTSGIVQRAQLRSKIN